MRRAWRFIKWCAGGIGWFEAYMLSIMFFLGGSGVAAILGYYELRAIMIWIALGIGATAVLAIVYRGCVHTWQRFLTEDNRVFDILKQEKIDGQ